jgi:hypothetical protein
MTSKHESWRDVLPMPVHPAADMFPMMSEAELRTLGEDIRQHGLRETIVLHNEAGETAHDPRPYSLLDGRNRLAAMTLVGIPYKLVWKRLPRAKLSFWYLCAEDLDVGFGGDTRVCVWFGDPYEYVISVNLHRRHLTAEQRRDLIDKWLKADPTRSDRAIAKTTKTDHKTVASVRAKKERRGEIPHVKTRTDSKGREQPAKKQKASKPEPKVEARPEPSATTAKSWKVEVIAKDGKRYGNGVRFETEEEADFYRITAAINLHEGDNILVATTEVICSDEPPSGAHVDMKRTRRGNFTYELWFTHGTCGTLEWEEIAAPAKVEPKAKVQQRPIQIIDDGTDGADQGDGPQQFWERSVSNLAGDAISMEAFWTRQHGAAWRDFTVPSHLPALAREAADAWNSLAEQLDARVVPVTAPATAADYMPESLRRTPETA